MVKLANNISDTVIRRMPVYHRYLEELILKGIKRISSQDLSEITGFSASQIRQDLNNFGGFGQQGYGYNTDELKKQIDLILGVNKSYNTVLIGAGRLGSAIARYRGFRKSGFNIKALFDLKKLPPLEGIPVFAMDMLKDFIKNNNIQVAIITVPKSQAETVLHDLVDAGIRGIWNFSPIDLKAPKGIIVENIRLNDSLLILSYYMKNMEAKEWLYISLHKITFNKIITEYLIFL